MSRLLPLAPLLLLLLACSGREYCAEAPLCEEGKAINCERTCSVGPCSTGAHLLECGESASCTVVIGDVTSPRFFRSRALCVVEGSASCDPATAPAPLCDGQGIVTGCSGYKHVIRASCSQAALYFTQAECCRGAGQADGGPPDGSTDGGP